MRLAHALVATAARCRHVGVRLQVSEGGADFEVLDLAISVMISAVVRNLLVQFVGDVCAYISSNKIDRFEDIRKKIKDAAKESRGCGLPGESERQ